MGFREHFDSEIRRRFPQDSALLCAKIRQRYEEIYPDIAFARTSPNPMDRRLEFCAYLLATIKTLEARALSPEQIRSVCTAIAESYVRPAGGLKRFLKALPAKLMGGPFTFLLARIMRAKVGTKGHPDGFLVRIVTGRSETNGLGYGFDILECGICTLFRKHEASDYVPVLCEIDRLTSAMAGLELIRIGTIATGAEQCDFRFRKPGIGP